MNDYPNDWLCAQHEAAHALLAHLLGGEVLEVTLRRTTYVEPRDYHDRLLITLAGWALSPEGTGADLDAALSLYQRWQLSAPCPWRPFMCVCPSGLQNAGHGSMNSIGNTPRFVRCCSSGPICVALPCGF
jgi:hypothetical protein